MDVATGGWKRYRQSVEMCAKDSQMRRHGLALGSVAPLFRRKGEEEEEDRWFLSGMFKKKKGFALDLGFDLYKTSNLGCFSAHYRLEKASSALKSVN